MLKRPRYQIRCLYQEYRLATNTTAAKIGNKVLMKMPSNWAKKPRPRLAPNAPRAGKHDAQPAAAINVPIAPALSVKKDSDFMLNASLRS